MLKLLHVLSSNHKFMLDFLASVVRFGQSGFEQLIIGMELSLSFFRKLELVLKTHVLLSQGINSLFLLIQESSLLVNLMLLVFNHRTSVGKSINGNCVVLDINIRLSDSALLLIVLRVSLAATRNTCVSFSALSTLAR